jgi:uncharacterized protein YkwD
MKSIMFFLPFLFAVITSCTKQAISIPNNDPVPSTVNKAVLLQLVNDVRKKGCNCGETWYAPAPAISWSDQLEKAAYMHSNDMYQKKYFSHTGSDGSNIGQRISAVGYPWKFYGENIAEGYPTEKEVITGWLSSPGHCANIMNKNYKEMGVAKAGDYWTQDFGSR